MKIDTHVVISGFKKYTTLCVVMLVSALLALWLYIRVDVNDEQQAELDKVTAEDNLCRANITNGAQLQQQVDFLVQANAMITKRAFRAESLALNLQYFYKIESEIGIKYLDLRPGSRPVVANAKAGNKQRFTALSYAVSAQGNFTQIINYLRKLEQGAYFCRINSASLIGTDPNYTITLDLDFLGIQ